MIASRDCLLREPFRKQAFGRKSMSLLRTTNLAALACLFVAGVVSAQEKKIKRSDLPPAVEKTAAEVSKGATIKGFSKETKRQDHLRSRNGSERTHQRRGSRR